MWTRDINLIGEFRDAAVEREYRRAEFGRSHSFLRWGIVMSGFVFFALSLYDYWHEPTHFLLSLPFRCAIVAAVAVASYGIWRTKSGLEVFLLVSMAELTVIAAYLLIIYDMHPHHHGYHVVAIMLIAVAILNIPNRWINSALLSLVAIASFAGLSLMCADGTLTKDIAGNTFYLCVAYVFVAASTYRVQYQRRNEYLRRRELRELTQIDRLTGAFSRFQLDASIISHIAHSQESGAPLSLLALSVEGIEGIKVEQGFVHGESVLVECAHLLSGVVGQGIMFARLDGEEFSVLLPGEGLLEAVELAERLRKAIAEHPFRIPRRIALSVGAATLRSGDTFKSLTERCVACMYLSRSEGSVRSVDELALKR